MHKGPVSESKSHHEKEKQQNEYRGSLLKMHSLIYRIPGKMLQDKTENYCTQGDVFERERERKKERKKRGEFQVKLHF